MKSRVCSANTESRKPLTPMQYPQKHFFHANLTFLLKNSLKSKWKAQVECLGLFHGKKAIGVP